MCGCVVIGMVSGTSIFSGGYIPDCPCLYYYTVPSTCTCISIAAKTTTSTIWCILVTRSGDLYCVVVCSYTNTQSPEVLI